MLKIEHGGSFEHGFVRIGRMGFATWSQKSVGIGWIRVQEE